MYGFQDLASQQQQRFWVFTPTGTIATSVFQTWRKPPGISFVHIIAVGGGAGGASGLGTNSGGTLAGGGGGGSGSVTNVFLPAYLVPDILYIAPGRGGPGGVPTTSTTVRNVGTAGQGTFIGYHPVTSAGYTLCFANGGNPGNSAGTGGTTSATNTLSLPAAQIGLRSYYTAQAGGTGTINLNTSNIAAVHRITGGVGGWGAPGFNTGPTLIMAGDSSLQTYNAYLSNTDTSPGPGGIVDLVNFVFGSGLPARAQTTVSAQASGNSYYGCGGAGGASGNPNSGAGGRGGDGFVIITCG
jgi:hypothetical protein